MREPQSRRRTLTGTRDAGNPAIGTPRRLTDPGSNDVDPTLSQNGQKIAFVSIQGRRAIFEMAADGTDPRQVGPAGSHMNPDSPYGLPV